MMKRIYKRSFNSLALLAALGALTMSPMVFAGDGVQASDKKEEIADRLPSGALLASRFAAADGQIDQGIAYLEHSLEAYPENVIARHRLMMFYLISGRTNEAFKLAESLKENQKSRFLVSFILSVQAVEQGNLQEAQVLLKKATNEGSGELWYPILSGWLGVDALQKPLKPIDISLDKDVPTFLIYHLALINDLAGFKDVAKRHYEEAARYPDASFRILQGLANFYVREGYDKELKALHITHVKHRPVAAALIQKQMEMPAPAAHLVGNAREGMAEVLFTMATILQSVEAQHDSAIYLRLSQYLRPNFELSKLMLGSVLGSAGYHEEGMALLSQIKYESPVYKTALIRRAMIAEYAGNQELAMALLKEEAEANPESMESMVFLGDMMRGRGAYAEAIHYYDSALQHGNITREDWVIYFSRGVAYEQLGDWEKAKKDLERAIELDSEQPEVLNYLGYSLLMRDQLDEAKQMIERAYALSPNAPHIVDSMGWVYFALGEYEKAVRKLEHAVAMAPSDATINDHLGDAYWRSGRQNEARYQWQRALTFSKDATLEASIREKLRSGLPASEHREAAL